MRSADDFDPPVKAVVCTQVEQLERRRLFSWIGATSGNTDDLSHQYGNPFNWTFGIINDDFSSANLTAATTIYLTGNRTTAGDLNLEYSGDFNLTFESSSTAARALTVTGTITGDFGKAPNYCTVTIGNATNPVNLDMNASTCEMHVNTGDTLILPNVLSDGALDKTGFGTLELGGANTYTGGTVVSAGTLEVYNSSNTTTQGVCTGLGSSTAVLDSGATLWLNYQLSNTDNYVTYPNAFSGSGTLSVTASATSSYIIGTSQLTGSLAGLTGTLDLFPTSGSLGKTCLDDPTNGSQPPSSATIIVENGTTLYLPEPFTYRSNLVLAGMGNSENLGALRLDASANFAGNIVLKSSSSIGCHAGTSTISGHISDGGAAYSLTVEGSGAITVTSSNAYSGGTYLISGQLNIDNTSAIGSGVLSILGGALDNTSGSPITLASNVSQIWAGSFTFVGSDSLDLGGGTVALEANVVLTTTAGLLEVDGVISGNHSLTKAGSGSLTLVGASVFSGGNVVNGGTESVNNLSGTGTGSGPVTVNSGATLAGTGAIAGAVTINSGGALSPGNTNTAIFSTGSVTIESGAVLNAVVNGNTAGTNYDQVDVTGKVTLNGGSLNLSGSRPAGGEDPITLLMDDGSDAVVGTFAGLSEGAGVTLNSVPYLITYQGGNGNDVVLTDATPIVSRPAAVSPAAVSGTLANLSVLGASTDGESQLTYTWSATSKPVGSAVIFSPNDGNAAKNATVTFDRAGNYTFTVNINSDHGGAVTSSVSVTVYQTLSGFAVSPANLSLTVNGSQSFSAQALDQFGQPMLVQPAFVWSCSGGTISSSGVYTAPPSPGNVSVTASSGAVTGSTTLTVIASGSAAASPTIVTGTFTTLAVLGTSAGGTIYTWSTLSKPTGATDPSFSVNGSGASLSTTATFYDAGIYTFQVLINNGSGTTTQTVSVPVVETLGTLVVSPANVTLNENQQSQFTASGFDQFGHVMATLPTLIWALQSGLGSVNSAALYTAPGSGLQGATMITVSNGAATASANITVVNAVPAVLTVPLADPVSVIGTSTTLTVLGSDDGGEANLTYTWTTTGTPPADVTFSANGNNNAKLTTATFTAAGSYSVLVTITDAEGLSVTVPVAVEVAQSLTSLVLTPTSSTIDQGTQDQISVACFDQFGNPMDVVPPLDWSIQSGNGSVSNSGFYTAGLGVGHTTVAATCGSITGITTLGIFNLPPTAAVGATATPGSVTGNSTELSVLGSDDEPEADLTYIWSVIGAPSDSVIFSANNTNAAKNTTAIFSEAGSYQFAVAIVDSQGAAISTTVTAEVVATLTAIRVSPMTTAVDRETAVQFTAVAYDQFGTPLSTQPDFTWSTDDQAGSMSPSGLYRAAQTGIDHPTITAAANGLAGTATIALRPPAAAPVKVHAPVAGNVPSIGVSVSVPATPLGSSGIDDSTTTSTTDTGEGTGESSTGVGSKTLETTVLAPTGGQTAPVKTVNPLAKKPSNGKPPSQQDSPAPALQNKPADAAPVAAAPGAPDQAVATVPEQVFSFLSPKSAAWKQMDKAKEGMTSELKLKLSAGAASVTSVGVSAAYLIWLLRGGSLLSSLLSLFPAWKTMDPLPVLESFENSRKSHRRRKEADHESLESLVDDADKPLAIVEAGPTQVLTKKAA